MLPEELFKLLKVAIVIERAGELPLAVLLPMRKEILQGVPMPAERFASLFRLQRWIKVFAVPIPTFSAFAPSS
jgi:hypothetical protein